MTLIFQYLNGGTIEAYCTAYAKNRVISKQNIREYDNGGAPLLNSGGREIHCGLSHVLLQMEEWIS